MMLRWPIHALHVTHACLGRGSILILASFPRVHMIYDFYDHWQIPISKTCQVLFKSKGYFILYLKLNQTKHTYSITLKYSEVLITTASQACKKNYMYMYFLFSVYKVFLDVWDVNHGSNRCKWLTHPLLRAVILFLPLLFQRWTYT